MLWVLGKSKAKVRIQRTCFNVSPLETNPCRNQLFPYILHIRVQLHIQQVLLPPCPRTFHISPLPSGKGPALFLEVPKALYHMAPVSFPPISSEKGGNSGGWSTLRGGRQGILLSYWVTQEPKDRHWEGGLRLKTEHEGPHSEGKRTNCKVRGSWLCSPRQFS